MFKNKWVLLVRLPGAESLLWKRQPKKSGTSLPRPPLRSPRRRARLPVLPGNGKSRVYQYPGYPRYLPAHGLFQLQNRGPGAGQRPAAGISAVLYDKAGIPAPRPGSHLSCQHAGPILRDRASLLTSTFMGQTLRHLPQWTHLLSSQWTRSSEK